MLLFPVRDNCARKPQSDELNQYLQDAGVPWRLYQDDYDVAGQDLFAQFFESFLDSKPGDPLYYNGVGYFDNNTLDAFVADAMNGTLPAVSWLIPQQALSEHPPWTPDNGAWLQKWLVDAVTQGDSWNDTVFIISYDGTFSRDLRRDRDAIWGADMRQRRGGRMV